MALSGKAASAGSPAHRALRAAQCTRAAAEHRAAMRQAQQAAIGSSMSTESVSVMI
jgi:hypothetical protein